MTLRGPLLSLTHGAGPLPLLGSQQDLVEIWTKIHVDNCLAPARPDAIIIISAHYHHDNGAVKVVGSQKPPMLYDYQGFPAAAYKFQYPASGHPHLAQKLVDAMKKMPLLKDAHVDMEHGFDHGTFVPMIAMLKHASIPIVPISVSSTDDAAVQLAIGEAIRTVLMTSHEKEFELPSVAVIASGSMFHNIPAMRASGSGGGGAAASTIDDSFNRELTKLMTDPSIGPAQRKEALLQWDRLPGARVYQPQGASDHFMPLLTLAAVAGYLPATEVVPYSVFNVKSTDFIWRKQ